MTILHLLEIGRTEIEKGAIAPFLTHIQSTRKGYRLLAMLSLIALLQIKSLHFPLNYSKSFSNL